MTHPPLVFIVGPTAVGKTEAGILLAGQIGGQIISCDAMQVYREINIASVKPTRDDLTKVKHHCLNLVSVTEDFNVARFRQEALKAIENILTQGKRPVMVGGSGMYISVLLDGIFEGSASDEGLRRQLEEQIKTQGIQALYERLKSLDTKAAAKIHAHDAKRIVRALEVVLSTQKSISQLQEDRQGLWGKYPTQIFGLNRPRAELYRRVEARIDKMFEQGLVEEIQKLSTLALSPTAQTLIGIPEVQGYLRGEYDLERAKYLMKLHTRHYVKRELTWFRREKRLEWIDVDKKHVQDIVDHIIKEIR